jgi:hypothetical protein
VYLELLGVHVERSGRLQPSHVGTVAKLRLAVRSDELAVLRTLEPFPFLLFRALGLQEIPQRPVGLNGTCVNVAETAGIGPQHTGTGGAYQARSWWALSSIMEK